MKPRIMEFPNNQTEVTESRINRLERYKPAIKEFGEDTAVCVICYIVVIALVLGSAALIAELIEVYNEMGVFYG